MSSGYLGLAHTTGVNSFLFGTTDTFNVHKNFAIFGDFGIGHGSVEGVGVTSEYFDGGVMYNVNELKSGKTTLVPYILFGLGGTHYSAAHQGTSAFMMPLGGGIRVYLGKKWGIAPDFRGIIIPAGGSGVAVTGQIFYDWAKK